MSKSISPVYHYLSNGMEIYLQPSKFAPLVSLQVLVKAGSIDEEEHEGGVAHVLEHMLFKGTKKFPATGQIASTVELEGGDINAYTTFDHTNFYLTAPSTFAKKGTELLLDVVQNSLLDAEELRRELEVVVEEIRRGRDNPNSIASHNLFSLFYKGTRLARPVIGYQNVVEKFTRETVHGFYKKWYVPNNMIFIAVGDFDVEEMRELLNKNAEEFPPQTVPQRYRPSLPEKTAPHSILERGPWQEARVQLATLAPNLEQHDMPSFDVFASVLGEGDSSRLIRILRDELQLVTSIDCSCFTPKYPLGLLGISFFGMSQTSLEAIKIVVQEIRRLAEVPPTDEELTRIQNALKAERIYSRESMEGIGRNVGLNLQTAQKMQFENYYMDAISKVTGKHVQQVAQKVLTQLEAGAFHISVALGKESLPECTEKDFVHAVTHAVNVLSASGMAAGTGAFSLDPTQPRNESAWLAAYQQNVSKINPEIKQLVIQLSHGKTLKINYRVSKRLPIVSATLITRGGLIYEPKDKNGVGGLTSSLLTRGTLRQSYPKFIEELEDNAASISAFSARDVFGMRFDSITDNGLRTAQMMLDCFFRPEFSELQWDRTYKETQETLIAQRDNSTSRLSRLSQKLLFPSHPYANSGLGTEDSIKNITLSDVKKFWQDIFYAQEFIFSIAGDFDLFAFVNLIEAEFKTWFDDDFVNKSLPAATIPAFPKVTDVRNGFDILQREQAHIALSFRSYSLQDPRRTALELAANILAGQSGRLFLDLRDQKSLAYTVSASQAPFISGGVFTAYIATAAHKIKESLEGLKAHIERLAQEPPTEDELKRARNSVLGAQSIESQYLSFQASQLAMSDVYGLGFDNFLNFSERVHAVTPEMVSQALSALLNENPPVISIVGPKSEFSPDEFQRTWFQ